MISYETGAVLGRFDTDSHTLGEERVISVPDPTVCVSRRHAGSPVCCLVCLVRGLWSSCVRLVRACLRQVVFRSRWRLCLIFLPPPPPFLLEIFYEFEREAFAIKKLRDARNGVFCGRSSDELSRASLFVQSSCKIIGVLRSVVAVVIGGVLHGLAGA